MKRSISFQLALLIVFLTQPVIMTISEEALPLIKTLTITKNGISIEVDPEFKADYLKSNFFIEYLDNTIDLRQIDSSLLVMPFIMNVISIIWFSGKTYIVDALDEDLARSLCIIRQVFRLIYPNVSWDGQVIAKKLVKNSIVTPSELANDRPTFAMMFSGGLDSLCTSLRYQDQKQLLITAFGHYDTPLQDAHLWNNIRNMMTNFARQYGHENAFFKSNYHDILNLEKLNQLSPRITNWRIEAVEGLGWAGLVAPLLVAKGCTKLLIASSSDLWHPFPLAANPFVDDNISFAGITVKHDAFDVTRVNKCDFIANFCNQNNLSELFVRVCQHEKEGKNCSKCDKCLRTILDFLAVGENPQRFGFVLSIKGAFERVYSYLNNLDQKSPLLRMRSLLFQNTQRKIQERIKKSLFVDKRLLWFLGYDFNQNLQELQVYKNTVNWDYVSHELEIFKQQLD